MYVYIYIYIYIYEVYELLPVCLTRFAPQWAQPLESRAALPVEKRCPGHPTLGTDLVQ